ncbi:hypothetical protein FRACYDRAFT_233570 [Fragilariopsis cylindrus CCMP1102]|uniref:Uncharacterized protein n=1 Tax=Fragilariopsis cylindrus CCMP1102 TaxID=635003 RepID=A0A1E7FZ20_9STRA|nr:hypothetical protein FRACYDRAFT_233570 [Fragilariopsis cylindrus CCMP1102]|eukprot:OEU23397.1 hypothetical protein FRACYDRAFT_233570 [Fragilariopsis cylindrus CCMP1102]
MGICFGKPSMIASRCKEADQYARRKKDNFIDQGLEKVRKDTIQQKKKLRHHVDDPDTISKRNLKRNNLKYNNKDRTDFKGNSGGSGRGGGFTQDTISEQRNKLKHYSFILPEGYCSRVSSSQVKSSPYGQHSHTYFERSVKKKRVQVPYGQT